MSIDTEAIDLTIQEMEEQWSEHADVAHAYHRCQILFPGFAPLGAKALCGHIKTTGGWREGSQMCPACKQLVDANVPCPLCGCTHEGEL